MLFSVGRKRWQGSTITSKRSENCGLATPNSYMKFIDFCDYHLLPRSCNISTRHKDGENLISQLWRPLTLTEMSRTISTDIRCLKS